jgi:hypothetical protein
MKVEYLVDAGTILPSVRAVTPRDAADLAWRDLGERAEFPVVVHDCQSDQAWMFVREISEEGRNVEELRGVSV